MYVLMYRLALIPVFFLSLTAWAARTPPHQLAFSKVIPSGFADVDSVDTITREQAAEDASFLLYFLESAYVSYPDLAQVMDFAAYQAWLFHNLAQTPEVRSSDLAGWLATPFLSAWEDNHFGIYARKGNRSNGSFATPTWHSYYLVGTNSGANFGANFDANPADCQLPADAKILPAQRFLAANGATVTREVFKTRTNLDSVPCRGQTITAHKILSPTLPGSTEISARTSGSQAYVRIATFAHSEEVRRQIVATAEIAKEHTKIVLDLRGNIGGNFFILDWLRTLGARVPEMPYERNEFNSSPATWMLIYNSVAIALRQPNLPAAYTAELNQRKTWAESVIGPVLATRNHPELSARHNFLEFERSPQDFRGIELNHDITVLIDGRCASACEYATQLLSKSPRTTVIGMPTTGANEGQGNPMPFTLPNSKLLVYVPTSLFFTEPARRYNPVDGINPQYWIESDALQVLQSRGEAPHF